MKNMKRVLIAALVLILIMSLGACSGGKDKSGSDVVTAGESQTDENANGTGVAEDGADSDLDDTDQSGNSGDSGLTETGQDLSGFPSKADWSPTFPEYQSSIVWNAVPKDYIGGLAVWALPKSDNDGYVNVRKTPSVSANVVGEIHHNTEDDFWWIIQESYVEDGQIFVGMYKVEKDDYTWTPVQVGESEADRGWVALEVVDLIAV